MDSLLPMVLAWSAVSLPGIAASFAGRRSGAGSTLFAIALVLAALQAALVGWSQWIDSTQGSVGPFSPSVGLIIFMLPLAAIQIGLLPFDLAAAASALGFSHGWTRRVRVTAAVVTGLVSGTIVYGALAYFFTHA